MTQQTMQAVRFHEYGDVDVMHLETVPKPVPAQDEVLVRVVATSVNPIDWRVRSGSAHWRLPLNFPIIPGCDFAGVIEATGEDVVGFVPGDEVYGSCGARSNGASAQYVALPAAQVALRPQSVGIEESAGIPTAAVTAYATLFDFANLVSGQRILVQAAAGGVGMMAVQFAKAAGAEVYATCSAGSAALVRSLGADVVIDYRSQRFEDAAKDMDVVFDALGGEHQQRAFACLKSGGYMAAIVDAPDPALLERYAVRGTRCFGRLDGPLLQQIAARFDAGTLRQVIDRTMPLDEIREAHRLSQAGHLHGKLLLRVP